MERNLRLEHGSWNASAQRSKCGSEYVGNGSVLLRNKRLIGERRVGGRPKLKYYKPGIIVRR